MSAQRNKISIIAPIYNESDGITYFHEALCNILREVPDIDFEVVCIDDGGRDIRSSLLSCGVRRFILKILHKYNFLFFPFCQFVKVAKFIMIKYFNIRGKRGTYSPLL